MSAELQKLDILKNPIKINLAQKFIYRIKWAKSDFIWNAKKLTRPWLANFFGQNEHLNVASPAEDRLRLRLEEALGWPASVGKPIPLFCCITDSPIKDYLLVTQKFLRQCTHFSLLKLPVPFKWITTLLVQAFPFRNGWWNSGRFDSK
jgi:hypothetical protein